LYTRLDITCGWKTQEARVESTNISFGEQLTIGMRQKGLDYRTLAKLVGVSHGYLWQLVNADKQAINNPTAKKKRPTRELTRELATVLDIDPLTLLTAAGYADSGPEPLTAGPTRYATYASNAKQLYQDGIEASAKGQADRAVVLLEAALERGGVSFVNAHAGLGMAHYQAGRNAQAVAEFNAALTALETDARVASIDAADLYYNRGMAYQRQAREVTGAERFRLRLAAASDFRKAIAQEGESQDLYHSALCYLLLEAGHPRRVLPYGRAFLHRQASGPARYTTAALDINLFMAYAYASLGTPGVGAELVDLSLQLCPNYWFAHYVKAALLALQTTGHPRRRSACLRSGLGHVRKALSYNPQCRSHFQAELQGDFKAWATEPEFLQLLEAEETP
jgi:tetratricopeptide (TPR) repeat protein